MRAITSLPALLLLVSCAAGCSNGTTTSPSTSPSTTTTIAVSSSASPITFASQLAVRGSASRTFKISAAGTIRVTLATLGNGTVKAGLGIGVPASVGPCSLSQSVVTASGGSPQITASADAGTYCVQLFDTGSLTEDTPFSITVEYP